MKKDERLIRELVKRWMDASKAGDTATVLTMMTDDVIFMVPGQKPFGKKAFAAQSAKMKGARVAGSARVVEVKVLGDWAWLRNRLKLAITPPGGKPVKRTGYTLTLLRRQANGAWAIARDANLVT